MNKRMIIAIINGIIVAILIVFVLKFDISEWEFWVAIIGIHSLIIINNENNS